MVFATKIDLAAELEISRATVQNFFAGKSIGRENFHKICQTLKLPWHEIADLTEAVELDPEELEKELSDDRDRDRPYNIVKSEFVASWQSSQLDPIRALRQQIQTSIQQQCGSLRVLDMSQPRKLSEIYTEVKLLEKISSRRRLNLSNLIEAHAITNHDRPNLSRAFQKPLPGLQTVEQYSKLMILGKPGAGKTTFLKQIATQCIAGTFLADRVPIFISLKDFAESASQVDLLNYAIHQLAVINLDIAQGASDALIQGRALLLLDGLDEVKGHDRSSVLRAVRQFVAQFHANRFVITCRIAAPEYIFEQFTEVEIADFDESQIASFAQKWFAAKDATLPHHFLRALRTNPPLSELATSPILLTLLCLIFEERGAFPEQRSTLYKEVLQVLLKTWDASRHIDRHLLDTPLSLSHKKDLLSHIALTKFEQGDYFFHQQELEQLMSGCRYHVAQNSTHVSVTPSNQALDGEAILKSIEAQHGLLVERARGIYSFPHCIVQEYLAAREIATTANALVQETRLQKLVEQITNQRWHQVFLLTIELLPNPDLLLQLMQQKIENFAEAANLHEVLSWLAQKTATVSSANDTVAMRALYFELELSQFLDPCSHPLSHRLDNNGALKATLEISDELKLDRLLTRLLSLTNYNCELEVETDLEAPPPRPQSLVHTLISALNCAMKVAPALVPDLQHLKVQLPKLQENFDLEDDKRCLQDWWNATDPTWATQLRATIVQYRNLGHTWQFNAEQKTLINYYYQANQRLADSLNQVCLTTRMSVYRSLLLPTQPEMPPTPP